MFLKLFFLKLKTQCGYVFKKNIMHCMILINILLLPIYEKFSYFTAFLTDWIPVCINWL